MCGIVGIASRYSNGFSMDEANGLTDMLVIDSFRGLDSTGVFGVDKHGNVEIIKDAVHGLDFVLTPEYKEWRGKVVHSGLFAVGHNRAATKGSITAKNAHPFFVDDKIVLVQNGTMRGEHKTLAKGSKDVEVDSEAIAHLLSEEPDIAKALRQVNAAYALVWFNTETKTLYMIRNNERPLYYAKNKPYGVIFASEKTTIQYAIDKYNLKYSNIEMLPINTLYSLHIDENHYEEKLEAINCNYVYTAKEWPKSYQGSRHSFHGGMGTYYWDHINGYSGSIDNQEVIERTLPFHPAAKKNDLKVKFNDYLVKSLPEYHIPAYEGNKVLAHIHEAQDSDKRLYIELVDYIPANPNPDCAVWWVYGEIISADDTNNLKNCVIYWIVHDATKVEVEELVSKTFFSVRINTVHVERFTNGSKEMAAVRAFGSEPRPFIETTIIKEIKENAQTH